MDSDTQALLQRSFERFTHEHYEGSRWHAHGSAREGFDPRLWDLMAELGWLSLAVPQAAGGSAESTADLVPLLAAAGAGLWREPLLALLGPAPGALLTVPDRDRVRDLLAGIAEGRTRIALAHGECAQGWLSGSVTTYAAHAGAGSALSGTKRFVPAARFCTAFLVTARDPDDAGIGIYLVESGAARVTMRTYRSIDDRGVADLHLDATPGVRLGDATVALAAARRRTTLLAAAEFLGVMAAANRAVREHLLTRRQFGCPLAAFQVLRHRVAEMHMAEVETRAFVEALATPPEGHDPDTDRALLALQVHAARAARFVTEQAIQLHGAIGMTDELRIGHYYKRVLFIDSYCGTAACALDRLAEHWRRPQRSPS